MFKKKLVVFSLILAMFLMVVTSVFNSEEVHSSYSAIQTRTGASTLAATYTMSQLENMFPEDRYWHGGNINTTLSYPCNHRTVGFEKACNCYAGVYYQCAGYAVYLSTLYTGHNINDYTAYVGSNAVDYIRPGSVVRYNYKNIYDHAILITSVTNDGYFYTDCNSDDLCGIRWSGYVSKSDLRSYLANQLFQQWYHKGYINTGFVLSYVVNVPEDRGETIVSGTYRIRNVSAGYQMDVEGYKDENGTRVMGFEFNTSPAQKFYIKYENGSYYIQPVFSASRVIDINIGADNRLGLGDSVDIWTKEDKWTDCQKVHLIPVGNNQYVIELASMKNAVLTLESNSSMSSITIREYNGSDLQKWYLLDADTSTVQIVNPCNHSYDSGVITSYPSCYKKGNKQYICKRCGFVKNEDIGFSSTHGNCMWKTTKEATCNSTGVSSYMCLECNKVIKTETIAKKSHNAVEKVVKEATCSSEGQINMVCSSCNAITGSKTIAKKSHNPVEKVVKEATCNSEGQINMVCSSCNVITGSKTIAKKSHRNISEHFESTATCVKASIVNYICDECMTIVDTEKKVNSNNHINIVVRLNNPTCVATGTSLTYCSDCSEVIKSNQLPKLDHEFSDTFTIDTPATTTNAGSKSRHCKNCSARTDITVIPRITIFNGFVKNVETGTYQYYKDGVASAVTGVVAYDNNLYYLSKGILDGAATRIIGYNGKAYFFLNGVANLKYTGLRNLNDDTYYVSEGIVDTTLERFASSSDGNNWLIQNGKVNKNYTGIYNGIYYIKNGKYMSAATGLVSIANAYYYVNNGKFDASYSGLRSCNGKVYVLQNGKLNNTFTGLIKNTEGTLFFATNGVIDANKTGFASYEGKLYYVVRGKVQNYYGLVDIGDKAYYFEHGYVDFDYSGFCYVIEAHTTKRYIVINGVVDKTYTGIRRLNGTFYMLWKGEFINTYTGIQSSSDGNFWYGINGVVATDFSGIIEHQGIKWLINHGKVATSFSGDYIYEGKKYVVRGGRVI